MRNKRLVAIAFYKTASVRRAAPISDVEQNPSSRTKGRFHNPRGSADVPRSVMKTNGIESDRGARPTTIKAHMIPTFRNLPHAAPPPFPRSVRSVSQAREGESRRGGAPLRSLSKERRAIRHKARHRLGRPLSRRCCYTTATPAEDARRRQRQVVNQ